MRPITLTVWTKSPSIIRAKVEEVLQDIDAITIIPAAETVQVITSRHTLGDVFVLAHMLAKLTEGRILIDVGTTQSFA